jgi:hypothetical protein
MIQRQKGEDQMMMKFTPRQEYADVSGVLNYGGGHTLNVREALDEEPDVGVIHTDNPHLQHVLGEYQGEHGVVFDVATVIGGVETPVERSAPTALKTPEDPLHTTFDAGGHAAVGYELLSEEELVQVAIGEGLTVNPDATKEILIGMIEQHEAALAAGSEV